jgi:hypothetical protein
MSENSTIALNSSSPDELLPMMAASRLKNWQKSAIAGDHQLLGTSALLGPDLAPLCR